MQSQYANKLLKRYSALQMEHSKWRGVWGDCARYCMPNASPLSTVSTKTRGGVKRQPVDPVGIDCATKLSSWLYSSTVYQGEEWFSFSVHKKQGESRAKSTIDTFLEQAAKTVLEVVSTSNFNPVYQQMLRHYPVLGTTPFYSEFDADGRLVCKQWPISDDICIAESAAGEPDTVFRSFTFTARQAVQEFGEDNLDDEIRKEAAKPDTADKPHLFLHCVFPRSKNERVRGKNNPENKPWASVYIDVAKRSIVKEGGYNSFPYQTPRFYNTGEIYGRSAAMSAIPALRSVNFVTYSYINNVEAAARPIIFAPPKVCAEADLKAGSINPYDSTQGQIVLWSAAGDMRSVLDFIAYQKESIRGIFYNDVFQYLEDRKNMTATEAQLRYDEMIQGISPVLANLQSEFFSPFLKRVFYELVELGRINPNQALLDDNGKFSTEFDVTYNTRLDTKLKAVLNANMFNALRMLAEADQLIMNSPTARLLINQHRYGVKVLKNNNVLTEIMNSENEEEASREQMNQEAQMKMLQGSVKPVDTQKTPESGSMIDAMVNGGAR